MRTRRTLLPFVLLSFLGCAEDLGEDPTPDGGPVADAAPSPDAGPAPSDDVRHTDLGDGVTETLVDGSDLTRWVLLDLDASGAEVSGDLETDTDWDLAIQRYHLRTNGGAGGPAEVRVAVLDGTTLDAVTEAPATGWRQDEEPSASEIPDDVPMGEEPPPSTVISNEDDPWYAYDPATHQLSPKERVYVLESTGGRYFAIQLVDYYSPDTAEGGYPAFQWKEVAAPEEPPAGQVVDASATDAWVHLALDGDELTVVDPATSTEWDLALQRTAIRTNGGASGPGVGGARLATESWDTLSTTDTVGFVRDALLPLPGPPGSGEAPGNEVLAAWYDYDPTTHAVSARPDDVYVIRGAAGDYAKLRITGWDDGVYTLELAPVGMAPAIHSTDLDASSDTDWVRFAFERGAIVDTGWDIAVRRTAWATDSGTSGEGLGGAADAEVADLATVTTVPSEFAVDEELPVAGAPGSGTYSGNPVLAEWYDYDFTTHTVSPKATVYVVRTTAGDFAKVRIATYADGAYQLEWVYAGAGMTGFEGGE